MIKKTLKLCRKVVKKSDLEAQAAKDPIIKKMFKMIKIFTEKITMKFVGKIKLILADMDQEENHPKSAEEMGNGPESRNEQR